MSRPRSVLLVLAGLCAAVTAVIAVWWWRQDRGETTQPATAVGPSGGSARQRSMRSDAQNVPAIDVRVLGEDARPVAGAVVVVRARQIDVMVVRTDAEGRAVFEDLEAGAWTVTASARGHVSRAEDVTLTSRREQVELHLTAGGAVLRGTVTDDRSGPIGGARVSAMRLIHGEGLTGKATASTLADDAGHYELTVEPGGFQVEVVHTAYAPVGRRVDVPAGGASANFALMPGGVIEGRVVGVKGTETQAIPGARVVARGGSEDGRVTVAGPDGRFRISGLPPATITFAASAPGWVLVDPLVVSLTVGEEVGAIELRLRRVARVSGLVVTEAGVPAPAVRVILRGSSSVEDATTDEQGAFEFPAILPGAYQAISAPSGWLTGATPVDVRDTDVTGVRVVRVATPVIVGKVVPAQLAEVWLESADGGPPISSDKVVSTKADGTFTLSPPTVGMMRVAARASSGAEGTALVTVTQPGGARVEIALRPGAVIAGRVVDEDAAPLTGVAVMALPVHAARRTTIVRGGVVDGRQVPVGPDGVFLLSGLHAGRYELRVLERGRALARPDGSSAAFDVDVADGQRIERILQVAAPRGTIRGVVLRADGSPVADAWVRATQTPMQIYDQVNDGAILPADTSQGSSVEVSIDDRDGNQVAVASPVLTNEDGRFELGGLRPLELTLVVEADRGALRGRIRAKPNADVTINVAGHASLTGTVTLDGKPVTAFQVELAGPTSTTRTFSGPGGVFSFPRLEEGTYTVEARSGDGSVTRDAVRLAPGASAEVALELVAYGRVTGTLTDERGQPVPRVQLNPNLITERFTTGGLAGPIPFSDENGRFEITVLPGKIRVIVNAHGSSTSSPVVQVPPGATVDVGVITVSPLVR